MNQSFADFNNSSFNTNDTSRATRTRISTLEWDNICKLALAVVTVLGNGLVIYLIVSRDSMRRRRSPNWFILSLSVADLFIGAFNSPVEMTCLLRGCSVQAFSITEYFRYLFLASSVANLCVLTLNSYLAVVYPFKYASLTTAVRSAVLLASAWLLSALVALPLPLGRFGLITPGVSNAYAVIFATLCIPLPMCFMIYAYVRIAIILRRHRREIRAQQNQLALNSLPGEPAGNDSDSSRNSTVATIAVVVVVFLLCNVVDLCWLTCKIAFSCQPSNPLFKLTHVLRNVNSAANVFAYSMVKGEFQRELKSLIRCN